MDHVWTSMIALLAYSIFFTIPLFYVILIPIAEGIIHYHIDWIKVHFGCKDNTKPLFWHQFGLDQLAHQATYLLMVLTILYTKVPI